MTDWITNRPPKPSDADLVDEVAVSTHIDNDNYTHMHWSRAAQGYIPWRHTFRWVPPEPEPPAPVIVTLEPEAAAPEQKPEKATRGFRVGQMWRTRKGKICKIVMITNDKDMPIYTNLGMGYWHRPNGKSCLATNDQDHEDDLIELISENLPTPAAPEPEPEPEKATRGFSAFTRVYYSKDFVDFVDCVVGTDNTAWVRHSANFTHWEQVAPLPQPRKE